jgi:hypothetical protein
LSRALFTILSIAPIASSLKQKRSGLLGQVHDGAKMIHSSLAGATLAAQDCCEAVQLQQIDAQKVDSCSKEQVRSLK